MTAKQREKVLTAIAEYAKAEVDLAFAPNPTKPWIKLANDRWKKIEDLLVVDAWEIRLPQDADIDEDCR